MFKQQILRAKNEGIPDHAITNSVCMSLLEDKRTADQLNSLTEQYDSTSLEGILSIIENLESGENSRNATERFHEICMEGNETARSYLGRLKRAHKMLFPGESERETNMIRKQFLDGFCHKGESLSNGEKRYLYNTPDINDLCARTMYILKDNEEKRRRMKQLSRDRKMDRQNNELNEVNVVAARQQWEPQRLSSTAGMNQRVSAGPGTQRVTISEYRKGMTNDGERVCYHCCLPKHIAKQCPNDSFCVYCGEGTNHPSIRHPSQAPKTSL